MVYANLIKEKVLDFYWQGFSYTTHCHNWLHAVPWWKNRISRPTKNHKYTVNHLSVQRLRNNNVSSDPSQSNCARSSSSLMSEGGQRFVLAATLPAPDICHPEFPMIAGSKKTYLPVRQLFYWWAVEGGLVSLLLGTSLLSEYMYPIIPFHALPYSLSLSGEKNFP